MKCGCFERALKWLFGLIALAIAGLAAWLLIAPPALIRVGAGYAAKIVCSNVVLAGRDADEVLRIDVQAPGHPLLKLMSVDVDEREQTVTAGLFGLFGNQTAIMRPSGGCSSVPDGDIEKARAADGPARRSADRCPTTCGRPAIGSSRRSIPTSQKSSTTRQ